MNTALLITVVVVILEEMRSESKMNCVLYLYDCPLVE